VHRARDGRVKRKRFGYGSWPTFLLDTRWRCVDTAGWRSEEAEPSAIRRRLEEPAHWVELRASLHSKGGAFLLKIRRCFQGKLPKAKRRRARFRLPPDSHQSNGTSASSHAGV